MSALDDLLLRKYRDSVYHAPARLEVPSKDPAGQTHETESNRAEANETERDEATPQAEQPQHGFNSFRFEVTAASYEVATSESSSWLDQLATTSDELAGEAPITGQFASNSTPASNPESPESEANLAETAEAEQPGNESPPEPAMKAGPATELETAAANSGEVAGASNDAHVDSSSEPENATSFKPEWEVDHFLWPSICGEIEGQLDHDLARAIAQVETCCQQSGTNVVVLADSTEGAGSTTMALCLARAATKKNMSVAIVDLDHQNPTLMPRLGVAFEQGIESLLRGEAKAEEVCVTAVEEGVSLIPAVEPLSLQACTGETVKQLIDDLSDGHDLVLIDASAAVAELMMEQESLAKFGVIFVTDRPASRGEEFCRGTERGNGRAIGIIQNFAA